MANFIKELEETYMISK